MADNGLLERIRSTGDERTVQIRLTPAGAALREPARGVQAEVERATGLSRSDLTALRDQLHALTRRLRSVGTPDLAGQGTPAAV
jgi:DNA-binding MarR family transcriptional regulator